ncbi:MAG TPA: helix-turn-helix domain-containing protein [Candidatus Dormibacteraeota bacterium]
MARRVLIVAHPGVLGMELLGARDIFEMVNTFLGRQGAGPAYKVEIATLDGAPARLWGGLELGPVRRLAGWRAPLDTLVVVGGLLAVEASEDPALTAAVRRAAGRARRVVGLCTGAFLLAAAGLLDGRRATTHWLYGDELAARHPEVGLDTGPIFVRDGDTWTSAGVTAAFDLLLALVEADEGADVARFVARALVVFLRRTGSQAQFSLQLETQVADRHPLREVQQFIADHPDADLSLPALAERVSMSTRHFARVFRARTGVSPGRYVERIRLETARRRLEESEQPVDAVAAACGFGNDQAMRRAFGSALGVSPAEYRRRFGSVATLQLVG